MLYIIKYILVKNQKIKSKLEVVVVRSEIYFRSKYATSIYHWGREPPEQLSHSG